MQAEREGRRHQLAIGVVAAARGQELQLGVRAVRVLAIVDSGNEQIALRTGQRRIKRAPHTEVTIAHSEDALHFVLARRLKAFLFDLPGCERLSLLAQARIDVCDVQTGKVGNYDIGPAGRQRIAVSAAIHADNETETAALPGFHASGSVLYYYATAGGNAEQLGAPEERGRIGLAFEAQRLSIDAIKAHVEQVFNACGPQHLAAVAARCGFMISSFPARKGSSARISPRRCIRIDPAAGSEDGHEYDAATQAGRTAQACNSHVSSCAWGARRSPHGRRDGLQGSREFVFRRIGGLASHHSRHTRPRWPASGRRTCRRSWLLLLPAGWLFPSCARRALLTQRRQQHLNQREQDEDNEQ